MKTDERLPKVLVRALEDRTAQVGSGEGFLRVRRYVLENTYEDGTKSRAYPYDVLERAALDAVAVVATRETVHGVEVLLRACLRPPLAFRADHATPLPPDGATTLWELPAGLVERDESGYDGLRRAGARELLEETGYDVAYERLAILGEPFFLTPGVFAEQVHLVWADLTTAELREPEGDGSAVEELSRSVFLPLEDALAACANGTVRDAKTELGLRRFAAARSP